MQTELLKELEAYQVKWRALLAARQDKLFFETLRPVALGWKVADPAQYERWRLALHEQSDHIMETWMNGRWVAKFVVRDPAAFGGIALVKIMQRRPGSKDAVGLDHLDFYGADIARAETVLTAEKDLHWTKESNDIIAGYDWLSIWFDGGEAKLKSNTVLDIVRAELLQANERIKQA